MNIRTKNNTLSFVLSPTIEDGKKLSNKELKILTKEFLNKMELKKHQAVAFVHQDKQHKHIHLYVNRIGFDGKAYKDSFIGKRSQWAAEQVAKAMGLTTAREVQFEKSKGLKTIRKEIKDIHDQIIDQKKPKSLDQYIQHMKKHHIKVLPVLNKANQLQGFRFEYKDHNLKGSEVHRSMSGGKIIASISNNQSKEILLNEGHLLKVSGKIVVMSKNMLVSISKTLMKNAIKKSLSKGSDIGI